MRPSRGFVVAVLAALLVLPAPAGARTAPPTGVRFLNAQPGGLAFRVWIDGRLRRDVPRVGRFGLTRYLSLKPGSHRFALKVRGREVAGGLFTVPRNRQWYVTFAAVQPDYAPTPGRVDPGIVRVPDGVSLAPRQPAGLRVVDLTVDPQPLDVDVAFGRTSHFLALRRLVPGSRTPYVFLEPGSYQAFLRVHATGGLLASKAVRLPGGRKKTVWLLGPGLSGVQVRDSADGCRRC